MEEKKKMMPKEDVALYRLLAIILFGVATFVFACFIGDAGMWSFFSSTATKIILITLFVVVAFFAVRGIIVGNPNNRLFTVGSICCVIAPVLLVLAFFHFFSRSRNGSFTGKCSLPASTECSMIWNTPVSSFGSVLNETQNSLFSSLFCVQ